jgi:hypothetical protein
MIDTMIRLRVGYNLQEYFLVLIKNASIVILHSTPLQIKQDEGIQGIRGVRTRSNLLLLFLFLRMEDSSMVVHLILELLHVALRRYLAIASSVSAVWSKASVGLFETLVARLDTQLLPVQLLPWPFFWCFGRLRETRRRKLNFSKVMHTPALEA